MRPASASSSRRGRGCGGAGGSARLARMHALPPFARPVFAALLAAALAAAAPAAMVDSGLSYLDAADDDLVRNVPRGSIGGGWHRASPGATAVLSPTGYSTPMW